jgi:hypothetical protein
MRIDESETQFSNAEWAIRKSFERDSNLNVERDPQSLKDLGPSSLTEEGMDILDSNWQFKKVEPSIDERPEPNSNDTAESAPAK